MDSQSWLLNLDDDGVGHALDLTPASTQELQQNEHLQISSTIPDGHQEINHDMLNMDMDHLNSIIGDDLFENDLKTSFKDTIKSSLYDPNLSSNINDHDNDSTIEQYQSRINPYDYTSFNSNGDQTNHNQDLNMNDNQLNNQSHEIYNHPGIISSHSASSRINLQIPPTPKTSSSVFKSPLNLSHYPNENFNIDVSFTPLISPAMTSNMNLTGPEIYFSPLTSPALVPQLQPIQNSKTQQVQDSTAFKTPRINPNNNYSSKRKSIYAAKKANTPKPSKSNNTTPILGPKQSNKVSKQSPLIRNKRSSIHSESLPDMELGLPAQPVTTSGIVNYNTIGSNNNNNVSNGDQSAPMTPAILMKIQRGKSNDRVHALIAPKIRKSSDKLRLYSSSSSSPENNSSSVSNNNINNSNSSSDNDNALLLASKSNYQHILEGKYTEVGLSYPSSINYGITAKKTNHKLAEQGRRNRMNNAIIKLGEIIPSQIYTKAEVVPSKATTIELSIEYIQDLLNQVNRLKERLKECEKSGNDMHTGMVRGITPENQQHVETNQEQINSSI